MNLGESVVSRIVCLIWRRLSLQSTLIPSHSSFHLTEPESHITTDGQSASLSWNKAPIWGLWPDFYYCHTVAVLFSLTRGRVCQRSHSRVRVPWDSRPYFAVSDSRLSFSSPPTTYSVLWQRYSIPQKILLTQVKIKVILWPTISRPVCLGVKHPSRPYDQIFITVRQCGFDDVRRSLSRENRSAV
jgi:hypothetical protein